MMHQHAEPGSFFYFFELALVWAWTLLGADPLHTFVAILTAIYTLMRMYDWIEARKRLREVDDDPL